MKNTDLYHALGAVDDDILERSEAAGRGGKSGRLKWGALAACVGLLLAGGAAVLPGRLAGRGDAPPPAQSDVPGPAVGSDAAQPSAEPQSDVPGPAVGGDAEQPGGEPLQPPDAREITIRWDGVAVNESEGAGPDGARLYRDPELYDMEDMDEEDVLAYYGWNLAPAYIPEGLTGGGNAPGGWLCREKATGEVVEDQAGRGFWADFWEDGSPKSNDDLYIPAGFTVRATRQGFLRCALLPVDEVRTTDFGGVSVVITHCSMKHGPFDPTQKAPDGLSNMPAGYYDIYVAAFTLDGVEYEIEAQRLELEEVVKITASVINTPYSGDFTVGNAPQ